MGALRRHYNHNKHSILRGERPRVRASPASLCCGPWASHIYPSLVLVHPRKTRHCLTERLLMGHKESNKQTNNKQNTISVVFHWLTISDIWSFCLPLTEDIKLRLLRKRELVAFLLLYSVDGRCHVSVDIHCLFLTVPWLVYSAWLLHFLVKLTYFFLHDKTILYEVYVLSQDTYVWEKIQSTQGLEFKNKIVFQVAWPCLIFYSHPNFLSTFKGFPSSAILFPNFPM